jgi:hypothetical protein
MPLIDKSTLKGQISPPLDPDLVEQILSEYISQERRFVLREWEPATLDGGQFAEAAARIIYHVDSGVLNPRKEVNECLSYVEDFKQRNRHLFPERKAAIHLVRVPRTIYKFRSDRGAVHIDPVYTANHLDAKLVIENSRWVLGELLRVFWKGDRFAVASAIREILQFELPVIGKFEEIILVQRTDCDVDEEILLLLHYGGEAGLSPQQLRRYIPRDGSGVSRRLGKLGPEGKRQIIRVPSGNFRLTDLGSKEVLTTLASKLTLQ